MSVRNLLCVEFPGIVQNVEKMLPMIGGVEKLTKCYKSQGDRLELRFRPDDDFCRGVYGDKISIDQVLVKVIKKTIKYSDGSSDITYTTKVIGICRSCYKYTSLMDFQYLPMERVFEVRPETGQRKKKRMRKDDVQTEAASCSYKSIKDDVIPSDPFDPSTNYELNEMATTFILPALFCRFDRPSINYNYRDNEFKEGESPSKLDSKAVIAKTRKSRSLKGYNISWQGEVPQEPKQEALDILKDGHVNQSSVDRVKEQFEIRPIWSKAALKYHTKLKESELKIILPTVAYCVVDGPYRCMWIKLGYDPKKHSESAPYQSLDYRVKFAHRLDRAKESDDVIPAKRSVYQYQLPLMKAGPRGQRRFKVLRDGSDDQSDDYLQSAFIFKDGLMPMNKICIYQLMDIDVPIAKELVSQKIPENTVFTEKEGWYPSGSIEKIRGAMNKVMKKMMADDKFVVQDEDDDTSQINRSQLSIDSDDDSDDGEDPEYDPLNDD